MSLPSRHNHAGHMSFSSRGDTQEAECTSCGQRWLAYRREDKMGKPSWPWMPQADGGAW